MTGEVDADKNLLVVVAVEEYARNHHLPTAEVFALFSKHNIMKMIRDSYDVLHTQDIYESYRFAESILERKNAGEKI